MASLGHIAVGLAAGRLHGDPRLARAMWWMSVAALLPDADVIAFAFGIPYGAPLGHRGASHALLAAPLVAILPALLLDAFNRQRPQLRTWLLATAVVATHGPLDTLTDGGLGAALWWPLSDARVFAPWRPIPVAPIGLGYLSPRGMYVALVELAMFVPLLAFALWPRRTRPGSTLDLR